MEDLISRQAAIDALNEYFARIGKLKRRGLTKGEKAISLDTVGALKTLPSADRPSGEWLARDCVFGVVYCSECGYELRQNDTNYCPNCGARMGGETDGRFDIEKTD